MLNIIGSTHSSSDNSLLHFKAHFKIIGRVQTRSSFHPELRVVPGRVPACAAAGSCTGPVWRTETGTARWFGSCLPCNAQTKVRQAPARSTEALTSPVQAQLTHRLQDVHPPRVSELLTADAAGDEAAGAAYTCAGSRRTRLSGFMRLWARHGPVQAAATG